ncbi:MBL fold metallo-hydrolase [Hymenobacter sp. BT175]|uniref:MBL fold metallo-hydrolase n=1 Tax=Hymenobacter translucens TaxID=2886507 RepID=UPI001D0F3910|nr:MBL fold metallo-hydrolase [Hymenobacter translucens]MCC2546586.1 MBL fold metallo-hydrolase [Hymenobacter translucens]
MKALLPFLFLTAGLPAARAQTPTDVVRRAMQASGPWDQVQRFTYRSVSQNFNPWQAYTFSKPKSNELKGEFHRDFTTGQYRNHTEFHYPGGYVFDFVTVGKDSTRFLYDRNFSRNGKALLKQGPKSYLANQGLSLQNQPYFLLKSLLESKDSLQYLEVAGQPTVRRIYRTAPGTQDYTFDKASGLLLRMVRQAGQETSERHFDDYRKVLNLQVPHHSRQLANGRLTADERVADFHVNDLIPAAVFDIPAVYQLPKAAAPTALAAKEIAKDVYLIEGVGGDRNVIFVNLRESVLVTEAPLNPAVTKSILDVIHKTLPGKRIGYVHLSHHHNDHITGIRQWVAEGATIISTPALEAPVRAILKGELGNFADDYAKNHKEPVFEFFQGVKTMTDGGRRIEFHAVPNSHAEGMSFLYLPAEGLIYEGDLLTIPEDGTITPAIAVSKEFQRYLQAKKLTYNRIIGHHSYSSITPALFQAYLKAK